MADDRDIADLRKKILDDLRKVGRRSYPHGIPPRLWSFINTKLPEVEIYRENGTYYIAIRKEGTKQ